MAKLGVRTVDELVGRTDLLQVKDHAPAGSRASELDLSRILANPVAESSKVTFRPQGRSTTSSWRRPWTMRVLLKKFKKALDKGQPKHSLGGADRVQHRPCLRHHLRQRDHPASSGNSLPEDTFYVVKCHGGGGQSFGAFIPKGLTLELDGRLQRLFGQGSVRRQAHRLSARRKYSYDRGENIIIGNVALYGATERQGLHQRRGRRALLRPQLRCHCRRRGRGRPRLRIYDRRHAWSSWARPARTLPRA